MYFAEKYKLLFTKMNKNYMKFSILKSTITNNKN